MSTRPPRYAIIGSRGYPSTYGGFETFVRRLAPFLRSQGNEVTVYGRDAALRPARQLVHGIEVVHTPGLDRPSTSTLSYGLTSVIHAFFSRPDAALVLNVAIGYWLWILRLARIPTVVNVDGIEWDRGKWNAYGKAVFRLGGRLTARFADTIVVDSRAIGDYWYSNLQVKSEFIPYGAEVVEHSDCDRIIELGLRPHTYLLVVARLVPENNVELFLDALECLDASIPAVVVGSAVGESPIEHRLQQLSATRPSFSWLGHVSDPTLLAQLWGNCALYVHGHSVGGTNPALLQALGLGSPTIALDTVYNREVLGSDWLLFPPADAKELAIMISGVLRDCEMAREMREKGQAIIASRYKWDDVLRRYADVLSDSRRQTRRRGWPPFRRPVPDSDPHRTT